MTIEQLDEAYRKLSKSYIHEVENYANTIETLARLTEENDELQIRNKILLAELNKRA